jgi:hypothetical protein
MKSGRPVYEAGWSDIIVAFQTKESIVLTWPSTLASHALQKNRKGRVSRTHFPTRCHDIRLGSITLLAKVTGANKKTDRTAESHYVEDHNPL